MKNKKTSEAFNKLKKKLDISSDYKLAQVSNLPSTSINRYINGKVSISLDKLNSYANNLGYELEITYKKI